ncbi:MAG: rod shape-determining protein MreC, partial [candidate division WOR-3 bacterium]
GRDPATMTRWLIVSRGRTHGVFPAAPVLAPEGVVGKVVAAGEHQALIQTILEPESRVSVISARSRVPALCRGAGTRLTLDYAVKGSAFLPGDTIVTAGTGQVFPHGLVVGVVEKAEDRPTELFKSVTVLPLADIAKLEQAFVFCLSLPPESLWTDPWLDNLAPAEVQVPPSVEER